MFSARLKSLPRTVQTKVTTPGAIKSIADIQRLTTRYHLTPKQVKTLASLTDHASGTIRTVNGRLIKLDRTNARPKVTVQDNASGAIGRIRAGIAGLHGRNIVMTTNRRSITSGGGRTATTAATGGWIHGPGTGTSDSIPAWLSNKEFVVNAAAAQRHGRLLEAINSNRYANGGRVGGGSAAAVSSGPRSTPVIVQVIDSDGVLRGTMRGVARSEVKGYRDLAATQGRTL